MRAAPQCAGQHVEPVVDPTFVVHDGKLANVVVWVREGLESWGFAPPRDAVVIDQKGCMYEPRVVVAMVGQPVEFRNSDPEPHNVHARPSQERGWNFMMSRKGVVRTVVFQKSEVAVPVGCDVHPWMRAYVAVVPHPYGVVLDTSGTARIGPLPPGTYTLEFWHEQLGRKVVTVTLRAREVKEVEVVFQSPISRGDRSSG